MRRLAVSLGGTRVGELVEIADGTTFVYDDAWRSAEGGPILSQSLLDRTGRLRDSDVHHDALVPYFANLLPEAGPLRRFLAARHAIDATDDFALLGALGENLAGAATIEALIDGPPLAARAEPAPPQRWRFSLAGAQMKFSAIRDGDRWSVTTFDRAGAWIVKLANADYPRIVDNEFAMMRFAAACGLVVPPVERIAVAAVDDLDDRFRERGTHAFAIRRFDRDGERRVHQEDFCQITSRSPADKDASYSQPFGFEDVLRITHDLCGLEDARELIRRFAFDLAVGNGDAHLKNIAVVYPNGRDARLAPLYDVLCTLRYDIADGLALPVVGESRFNRIDGDVLAKLGRASGIGSRIVRTECAVMAERCAAAWPAIAETIEDDRLRAIVDHRVRNGVANP